MLQSFGQVRPTMLRLGMRTSSNFQLATYRNISPQGGQTRATCCVQQYCDLLCSNVVIVWLELTNVGPALLGYVALRCCYRLAGAQTNTT